MHIHHMHTSIHVMWSCIWDTVVEHTRVINE